MKYKKQLKRENSCVFWSRGRHIKPIQTQVNQLRSKHLLKESRVLSHLRGLRPSLRILHLWTSALTFSSSLKRFNILWTSSLKLLLTCPLLLLRVKQCLWINRTQTLKIERSKLLLSRRYPISKPQSKSSILPKTQ